ncbi:DUF2865 domain-containing protein [Rhizobium sp. G21]|uniref:DUF2865 domain-containing protein n=1 Tax=Rhizobium sp. G21 TaxID=2758439 RepID=UPI0015FF457D|nr:DUF2865 domain-containing protein [Rhizobium sp. G21]MBB1247919.1 DUF2865 domain-containing protein [Rhizobium sp. G21]
MTNRLILPVMLAGLALPGVAAASEICDRLRFDLATLTTRESPIAQGLKYARAINDQKSSLRELNVALKEKGCSSGSILAVGADTDAACSDLEDKQARMRRNLSILERKRLSLLSTADDQARQRRRLQQELDAQACTAAPQLVSAPGVTETPLVRDAPGGMEIIRAPEMEDGPASHGFVDLGGAGANGGLVTMCVRTCDGAYFPISSRASSFNFRRDAQVCSMMCPGHETELFYHSIMSESTEMRSSTSGQAYAAQSYAWRFRTQGKDAQCGCNFSLYYSEMLRREAVVSGKAQPKKPAGSIVWVKPQLRGGLPEAATENAAVAERPYQPDPKIRVIGPIFLPDDHAIDFRKPVASEKDAG